VLFEQVDLLEHLRVVLHIVLLLGQKHRKVALFLGQFCGQTPVAEQVVALEHLLVVLSVLLEVLLYGGCFVSASLNIYVQKDKQGIRACLNAIQFRKAGEPFGTVVGDQRSKFSQVEVAPLGAQTTQPAGAPVQQHQLVPSLHRVKHPAQGLNCESFEVFFHS
jgi:hypothetical protein